jgi:hypothetical protein
MTNSNNPNAGQNIGSKDQLKHQNQPKPGQQANQQNKQSGQQGTPQASSDSSDQNKR